MTEITRNYVPTSSSCSLALSVDPNDNDSGWLFQKNFSRSRLRVVSLDELEAEVIGSESEGEQLYFFFFANVTENENADVPNELLHDRFKRTYPIFSSPPFFILSQPEPLRSSCSQALYMKHCCW